MPEISFIAAFLAGLLSFLSPCVLPIVPFFLVYLSGESLDELQGNKRVIWPALRASLFFAFGMLFVFVLLGASAHALGRVFADFSDYLRFFAAALIALMGLHFLGLINVPLLNRQAKLDVQSSSGSTPFGAFLMGFAFAFGWTPCVGPVLSMILFQASTQETANLGVMLLLTYGLGMSLPFVLAAVFSAPALSWMARFKARTPLVQKILGAVLLLFAVLIATNWVRDIAFWILSIFPYFANIG